jgi:peptidyl-prolyl cis-trans isomerase SurA
MCWLKLIKRPAVLFAVLCCNTVLSAPALASTVDRVVAKVNSEIVTLSAVQDRLFVISQQMQSSGTEEKMPSQDELMKTALNSIINERLQAQEAKKVGYTVTEESLLKALDDIKKKNNVTDEQFKEMLAREGRSIESYKEIIRDQILVSRISQMQMGNIQTVPEEEIKKYYVKNQKAFWNPPRVKARHILFIVDEGALEKDIRLKKIKAREILRRIRAGKNFAELAKKYSEDVSAHEGGKIGVVEHGMLVPEFEEVVFRLKSGEVSDIVKTRYGLHIIKCDDVIAGHSKPFVEVKEKILGLLSFNKRKKIYDNWVNELKKTAFVEISLFEDERDNFNNIDTAKEPQTASLQADEFFKDDNDKPKNIKKPKRSRKPRARVSSKSSLNAKKNSREYKIIKKKLKYYKKLRYNNKISEQQYQKKKKELLKKL